MRIPALSVRQAAPVLLVAGAGLFLSVAVERGSEQRANRLHRAGDLGTAAGIYADRVEGDPADPRLRYNLGTTLLGVGGAGAGAELTAATDSRDADLRVQSLYNLGLWNLERAAGVEAADSARAYALASVAAGKEALRLSPGRADARWNLAIAQRMLDSIQSDDGRSGTESVEGSAEADQLVRTDEARELQDASPVGDDGPQEGEEETPALAEGDRPLSVQEADDILESQYRDASIMIQKLLAYEGRANRRTRFGRTTPRW